MKQYPEWLNKRLCWKKPRADESGQFPTLKELLHEPGPCNDCNRYCEAKRVVHGRRHVQPYHHWRMQCNICRMYYNPTTKKFDLNGAAVRNYYVEKKKS